ncbi:hypothetical protein CEXT_435561 [Caerostris extrusa]|uniref:Ycf15 n=1 Tax=Caerostris extrusa TaxID=172846 RepID=A0AAV4WWQ7_CAEEX|nr:hypothetical protein CEXT_435561 [Caerostris extrusa]
MRTKLDERIPSFLKCKRNSLLNKPQAFPPFQNFILKPYIRLIFSREQWVLQVNSFRLHYPEHFTQRRKKKRKEIPIPLFGKSSGERNMISLHDILQCY